MSGGYRCPLARLIPETTDTEEIKREGWQEQRILVVSLDDDRITWIERKQLEQIGDRIYGRRKTE